MRESRESKFWSYIKKGMGARWVADRIETSVALGVADVSFSVYRKNGHIELKALPCWPKRSKTPVRIDHWTEGQKLWLNRKGGVGGDCWLFVKVIGEPDEFFLFSWAHTYQIEGWNREEWRLHAEGYWRGSIDWEELIRLLRVGC